MRIFHIVRDLDVASGGPSRSIPALAKEQAQYGANEVQVLFGDRGNDVVELFGSAVGFHAIKGGDLSPVISERSVPTIFHLHGLWSPILHRATRFAAKHQIPYVVSTRGMLAGWALGHKALKKRMAWKLYQRKDLVRAACLLASSRFEKEDIESLMPGKEAIVIPNGCTGPPEGFVATHLLPDEPEARWAMALGRLHPVKGYAELIEAWSQARPTGWKLAIAGPDEDGYRSVLEQQVSKLKLNNEVRLLGAVNDDQKWSLLDQCNLFLAPSKTENFGMAIAEAMLAGCPVITTKGTPWQELEEHACGWWIDLDIESVKATLTEATGNSIEALEAMGARGNQLISEKYTWRKVAEQTIGLYQTLLGQGA